LLLLLRGRAKVSSTITTKQQQQNIAAIATNNQQPTTNNQQPTTNHLCDRQRQHRVLVGIASTASSHLCLLLLDKEPRSAGGTTSKHRSNSRRDTTAGETQQPTTSVIGNTHSNKECFRGCWHHILVSIASSPSMVSSPFCLLLRRLAKVSSNSNKNNPTARETQQPITCAIGNTEQQGMLP
jgi:hypothetical protein